MDRNFFTAIALSFLVLVLYQSLFVMPKRAEMIKNAQHAQSNSVIELSNKESPVTVLNTSKPTSINLKEEITKLQTTTIKAEFSNVGGSLHKITLLDDKKSLPLENMLTIKGFENIPFLLTSHDENSIVYSYSDSEWKIVKKFNIQDHGTILASIETTRLNNISRLEGMQFSTIRINTSSFDPAENRDNMLEEFSMLGSNGKVFRKGSVHKFTDKDKKSLNEPLKWVGFRNHYHAFIIKPEFETKSYETEVVTENILSTNIKPQKSEFVPRETIVYNFTIVAGPQDIQWLKTYHKDIEKIVAFSGWWIIDVFAKGVYYTIPILHNICRSWGFSIILISLLIYGLTYPLTMKSMSSMRKMQLVQPQVAALQKKHKGDPQKLNSEMVALYKKEGVNPLGGCLPFILQMPVFMALYQVLWRAYYFQGKSFLWMKDLALPDKLFILPFNLPFLGNEFNILPIVMGAVMFLQQKFSSKNMVITDETQAMQQKMMKYFLPVFIAFIFYHFASGLSLYFTVFYALSTWAQWKMAKAK